MTRFSIALPVVAVALALAPAAFARDIKETKTFTKADGAKVVEHTSFHTKTDVTDLHVKTTRPDGDVRTVSETISPAATGGFDTSKTVTGFNGQSHHASGHIGGGKKS